MSRLCLPAQPKVARGATLLFMADAPQISVPSEDFPVRLTDKAVQMAKKKLAQMPEAPLGLRLGVKGGGCSGFSYVIDAAKTISAERDLVAEWDGLKVVVDRRSVPFLRDSTLDWQTELMGYGFRWHNPNVKSNCGCGESFELRDEG